MSTLCTWLDDVRAVVRPDWPTATDAQARGDVAVVHRAPHWVLWADGTVTRTGGSHGPTPGMDVRPDAVGLIDAVWHSAGHVGFPHWGLLARVERVTERETLGMRWPMPWEESLERVVVETVDGGQRTLFVHAVLAGERLSTGTVTVHTTLPESLATDLDRPEPVVLYDLENPLHGTPKVSAGTPRYVLVRPSSRCATAFHRRPVRGGVMPSPRYTRRDHPSLRAVLATHRLHPNQVRPVWSALRDVPLETVARVESQRWNVKATVAHTPVGRTPAGVLLTVDGMDYGPCGTPWDVASILAALSPARRKAPVRTRGVNARDTVNRASGPVRR